MIFLKSPGFFPAGYDDYDSSRGPSFSSSGSGNYYGGNTLTGETYPHYPSPGYGSGYGSAPSGPEEYPFSSSGGNQHQVGTFGVSNKVCTYFKQENVYCIYYSICI